MNYNLSQISLDLENPRHTRFQNEAEVIDYLCKEEKILELAKDIAENGLNPLELLAVIKRSDGSFFCAEGNRRVCALKLLDDPELAPDDLRTVFIKASENWQPIKHLNIVEFTDRNQIRLWLDRIHAGPNKGRGRRQWKPEQKARNNTDHKSKFALAVLDDAEKLGYISKSERTGRLSTVTVYLSNPIMREALGLSPIDFDPLTTDLSGNDFQIVFKKFIEDVAEKEITTRANKTEIENYAKDLGKIKGLTNKRVVKRDLISAGYSIIKKTKKPPKVKPPTRIAQSDELCKALEELDNYKLRKIYYSLYSIGLANHTPLLYVGAWSFLETLTALFSERGKKKFSDYLDLKKIVSLSIGKKNDASAIFQAITRIHESGNTTKHHKTSAALNGDQLANDFQTIDALLIALAKEAKKIKEAENTDP